MAQKSFTDLLEDFRAYNSPDEWRLTLELPTKSVRIRIRLVHSLPKFISLSMPNSFRRRCFDIHNLTDLDYSFCKRLLRHDEDAIRFVLCQFQGVVSDKACNYCLKEGRKCVKVDDKPDESCAECLYSKLTCTPEVIDLTFDDGVEIKEEVISEPVRIESGTTDRQESKRTVQMAATKRTRTDKDEQNRASKEQDESIDGTGQIVKRRCVSLPRL